MSLAEKHWPPPSHTNLSALRPLGSNVPEAVCGHPPQSWGRTRAPAECLHGTPMFVSRETPQGITGRSCSRSAGATTEWGFKVTSPMGQQSVATYQPRTFTPGPCPPGLVPAPSGFPSAHPTGSCHPGRLEKVSRPLCLWLRPCASCPCAIACPLSHSCNHQTEGNGP